MEPRFGHDFSRVSVHSNGLGMIQTKLKINKPGDLYEQEADRVAEQVMRMEEPRVQRQPDEELVQTKPVITPLVQRQSEEEEEEEEEFIQTKELPGQSPEVTPSLSSRIQSMKGGGQTLPESVRAYFEPRFGYDFSQVRMHTDARAAEAVRAVNARAFTVGWDVVFGAGEYAPGIGEGQKLLAHELTHVVQQGGIDRVVQRHNVVDTRLPADQPEAFTFAAAANTEIQAALAHLATDTQLHRRNVPALVTQEGIVLRPLTPRHDSPMGATNLNFFHGSTSYTGSVTLPDVATHHISANSKTISIRAREHADIDNMLFTFLIDEFVAVAVLEAGERLATRPTAALTDFERYRARFNAIANENRIMFILDAFDPTLDSHGPRFLEARSIFDEIYASDPTFRHAYDVDTGGIKERADSYMGPDSLNPIASPGLQRLRAAFFPFSTPVTALATYNSLRAAMQTASSTLGSEDRAVVDASNAWRQLINAHVITTMRRTELRDIIRTPPAPPAAAPPPAGVPPPAAAPAGGGVTPQSFVDSVSLAGPAAPVPAIGREVTTTLSPRSTVANPGVAISSQITVTPPIQVGGSNVSPASPWATGAMAGVDFRPTLLVSPGAALDAQLALVNGPAGLAPTNPFPPFHFMLDDQRQTNFATVWQPELKFFNVNGASTAFQPGVSAVRYMSGAQNFQAIAAITALPGVNPGLSLQFEARVDRAGSVIAAAQQTAFPVNASRTAQISLNVSQPPGGVPPGTTDLLDVEMRLLDATGGLVHGSARTQAIHVGPEATYTQAQAQTTWNEDEDFFHSSPGLLDIMMANGGDQARFADAVRPPVGQAPLLTFHPLVIRHDSAAFVAQFNMVGGVPTPDPSRTAYFVLTPYGVHPDTAHSFVNVAGAGAFNIRSFPGIAGRFIVVNRTADPSTNAKDPVDVTIQLALHEAVHALDEIIGPSSDIERYRTEFRAYWMDARYGPPDQAIVPGQPDLAARYDPDLPPPGPKSPRARKIFSELYGSVTYPWVQPNYDNNVNHFREQVDTYIVPDGINLILSRRLEALRVLIDAGVTPIFGTFQSRVQAFFGVGGAPAVGVLDPGERDYIRSSRAWRDLVNAKVSGLVHRNQIKNDMGIPL
jgi:hypothetical protein